MPERSQLAGPGDHARAQGAIGRGAVPDVPHDRGRLPTQADLSILGDEGTGRLGLRRSGSRPAGNPPVTNCEDSIPPILSHRRQADFRGPIWLTPYLCPGGRHPEVSLQFPERRSGPHRWFLVRRAVVITRSKSGPPAPSRMFVSASVLARWHPVRVWRRHDYASHMRFACCSGSIILREISHHVADLAFLATLPQPSSTGHRPYRRMQCLAPIQEVQPVRRDPVNSQP